MFPMQNFEPESAVISASGNSALIEKYLRNTCSGQGAIPIGQGAAPSCVCCVCVLYVCCVCCVCVICVFYVCVVFVCICLCVVCVCGVCVCECVYVCEWE